MPRYASHIVSTSCRLQRLGVKSAWSQKGYKEYQRREDILGKGHQVRPRLSGQGQFMFRAFPGSKVFQRVEPSKQRLKRIDAGIRTPRIAVYPEQAATYALHKACGRPFADGLGTWAWLLHKRFPPIWHSALTQEPPRVGNETPLRQCLRKHLWIPSKARAVNVHQGSDNLADPTLGRIPMRRQITIRQLGRQDASPFLHILTSLEREERR
eukprot:Skav213775  [mRNA]  locus=scaffold3228:92992:93624:+ [translate_table: standard]